MSKERQGNLDSVEMMRSIRDELSRELEDMTHEEQRRFVEEQLASSETDEDDETQGLAPVRGRDPCYDRP